MGLILFYPTVAYRDCQHCLKYLYDEDTGKPNLFRGQPVERTEANPSPCRSDKGCPKGTPENPISLNFKNLQAYQHWKECKAVCQFPDDELVRKNAALIQELVNQSIEQKQIEWMSLMITGKSI